MNLVKTLLATTFALTAATATFAASDKSAHEAEKVVVYTQEQPSDATQAATDETAAGSSSAAQPASGSAAETPATPAPQAGQ